MKVLVVGKFYTEGFALHIAETLEMMGHSVRRYEPGVRRINARAGNIRLRWFQAKISIHEIFDRLPQYRELRFRELSRKVNEFDPDLTIVCHDSFLWPFEVEKIKKDSTGIVVLWFPDSISNLRKAYCVNAPYDFLFFKDPHIVNTLRPLARAPVYYLPECFNPERHRMPADHSGRDLSKYQCQITTAGNLHSFRVAFLKQLEGYEIKVWGNPPPLWLDAGSVAKMFTQRFVANEEKALAFRGARIVVNNLAPSEVCGINARAFEAAGIGSFQLINWRPALDELFTIGEEIIPFMDMNDLKSKIDYYLDHDDEREAIARKAQRRALRDHTYEKRLQLLIDTAMGKKDGFSTVHLRNF